MEKAFAAIHHGPALGAQKRVDLAVDVAMTAFVCAVECAKVARGTGTAGMSDYWLLLLAVFAACVWFLRRIDRPPPAPPEDDRPLFTVTVTSRVISGDSRPDNPRFATWEEAMNRPVTDALRFRIEYCDADGVVTEREIAPIAIKLRANEPAVRIDAHCFLRNEGRTFHSARILSAVNLQTGRPIRDLGQYLRSRY